MNGNLQNILQLIGQSEPLTEAQKDAIVKAIKDADKELTVTAFKLERTEKVKHTTAILLEETIEELEQKRKAVEAQNRELEIESALERVRSRSLAMHKSEELQAVVFTLFERLKDLNIKTGSTNILIFHDDKKVIEQWVANDMNYADLFKVPYNSKYYSNEFYESKKQQGQFQKIYSKQENREKFEDGFKHSDFARIAETRKEFLLSLEGATEAAAFGLHSAILLYRYEVEPFSDTEIELLKRFAKVFEQAFTRFLDLQKAEAQAREAKIEAALERVRSRTMAMHKSQELEEVAIVMFDQLKELGLPFQYCYINIFNEAEGYGQLWGAFLQDEITSYKIRLPLSGDQVTDKILDDWKRGVPTFSTVVEGKERINAWWNYVYQISGESFFSAGPPADSYREEHCSAYNRFGFISIVAFNEKLPDGVAPLLQRFSIVFEQTYTRFLDLQKAEAQAREGQIELGLERVRARAMAMQHSNELAEAAQLLYHEFGKLGINTFSCGYMFVDEPKQTQTAWVVLPDGSLLPDFITFPLTGDQVLNTRYKDWKEKKPLHVLEIRGKENKEHHQFLSNYVPPFVVEDIFTKIPERVVFNCANFSDGYLLIIATEYFSPDEQQTITRFAKVFEQTYTRFLDLKKAEAQAREAQTQLALERVRARTMAMQKSNELSEVVSTLYIQLGSLDFGIEQVLIAIFDRNQNAFEWWSRGFGLEVQPVRMTVPFIDHPLINWYLTALQNGTDYGVFELKGRLKKSWDEHLFKHTDLKNLPEYVKETMKNLPELYLSAAFIRHGSIEAASPQPLSEVQASILKRLAKVFEQSYTRFLDLQKAEAQAYEARIEVSLERIRSRSLAMHNSSELSEVSTLLFKELFGFNDQIKASGIVLCDRENPEQWMCSFDLKMLPAINIPKDLDPPINNLYKAWQIRQELFCETLNHEDLIRHEEAMMSLPEIKAIYDSIPQSEIVTPQAQTNYAATFKQGYLLVITEFPVEGSSIFPRFARVFEQTYTRFLDLQKAEAQAREAEIEAAMERVRARAMAMRKSEELKELIGTVFIELTKLDLVLTRCLIMVYDTTTNGSTWWMANSEAPTEPIGLFVKYHEHPPYLAYISAWKERNLKWQYILEGKIKKDWDDFLFTETELSLLPDFVIAGMKAPDRVYLNSSFNSFGNLTLASLELLSDEHFDILLRFAKVFDLTYTRFNDLKKAEAQAREAQIELGLERVRARTMAMQKSDELMDAANLLFQQVQSLEIPVWTCGYNIWEIGEKSCTGWMSTLGAIQPSFRIPLTENPSFIHMYESRLKGESYFVEEISGEALADHYSYMLSLPDFREIANEQLKDGFTLPVSQIHNVFNFNHGNLIFISADPVPGSLDIFKRFTAVFEQTYTRFLDLQNAEEQAREAQIQLSLERVRARGMSMYSSNELVDLLDTVFKELTKLDIRFDRCIIMIYDPKIYSSTWWFANPEPGAVPVGLFVKYHEYKPYLDYLNAWKARILKWEYLLEGVSKKEWDSFIFKETELSLLPEFVIAGMKSFESIFLNVSFNNFGSLTVSTTEPLDETSADLLLRFAKVFDSTYTRFNDLQKAEAQALEAVKRASVDRVRAEIASMRTTSDLERITPLIWNELTTLGVPFIRCGVFIMDEETQQVQSFLSTPDGRAIAGFRLPYYATKQSTNIVTNWRQKKIFRDHMDEAAFAEYTKNLMQQGAITSGEKYLTENRPKDLYLHFLPFLQGMLYAGNTEPLNDDALQLVQNLADAFSTAYARYEDFNRLEQAKEQIEKTLSELKDTQRQLIQSEKMASLGELTAGIAHEIQNPLNFVNNFSDVNAELLDELQEELTAGNTDEAIAIANDIKENEQKINHHGKRADAIVKGMLQHSRTSTGQKEPADINKIADEYLRLSYHGLRAKDKSFNADIRTEFDENIGKINIVPQEIGRVLLNLFNNAFYSVNQKQKAESRKPKAENEVFKPVVEIIIRKFGDKVQLKVTDNGTGIPSKVLDKIFQPFFTTKPTGQGTGLGLSLSYDIIKAHGGEIKVETQEGEGTTFTIELPGI